MRLETERLVLRELVRFGFVEPGLHRVWSWCVADNQSSARVLEKVGMQLEGRQRERVLQRAMVRPAALCDLEG